jgi:pimeloyl-ACP methyl ester carboxylesterase
VNGLAIAASLAAVLVLAGAAVVGYFLFATSRIAAAAERQVPPVGRFVDVDGNRLHYVEAGSGQPILFLHGLGGQLHHFRHTLFSRLAKDFHLVAVDRPGSGYSRRAAGSSARLSEQARVVAHVIDRLGLEKPLVVGHSLGGAVALALALDHPDKVGGLVLLSPLTHLREEVPPEFKPLYVESALLRWLISRTTGVPAALRAAPQTLAFVFGPQKPPPDYIDKGGGVLGLRPAHFEATMADLTAIHLDLGGYEKRYAEIGVPVGLLFGTADRVLKQQEHTLPLTGTVRDLDAELVDGMGHMPQFVEPDRVETMIRRLAQRSFAARAAG